MKIKNIPSGPLMVNTYLVWDENTKKGFIVDPGGFDRKMVETAAEDIQIKYIILTHGHADHMGGVEEYLNEYKTAKLVAAEPEKPLLADPNANLSNMTLGKPVILFPDIAVKDGETMEIGGMKLEFIMTPGHTKGGMCIKIGKVLFSGDTLFRASVGRTDFPGGSFEELADSVYERLFVLPDETLVFPGHMEDTDIGYEKKHNPFV